jgi:hypothetical protein
MNRLCLDCGTLTQRTRCPDCDHRKDRARQQRRGDRYGHAHQQQRALWQQRIDDELVHCWSCGLPLPIGDRTWHLGHRNHLGLVPHPEHAACNLRAAGAGLH